MSFAEKALLGLALAGLVGVVGSVAVPLPASAQTSEVCDPVGDALRPHAPTFRDIVCNGIRKEDEIFFLRMEMAGLVPESPPLPPGVEEIWWYWPLDLDPATAPAGYPFGRTHRIPGELLVVVAWDGTEFTGTAIDRRPLLIGEDAIITPLSFFSIDGETVTAELDSRLFEAIPETFLWLAIARDWHQSPGTRGSEAFHLVDGGGGIGHGDWTPFPLEPDP